MKRQDWNGNYHTRDVGFFKNSYLNICVINTYTKLKMYWWCEGEAPSPCGTGEGGARDHIKRNRTAIVKTGWNSIEQNTSLNIAARIAVRNENIIMKITTDGNELITKLLQATIISQGDENFSAGRFKQKNNQFWMFF